MGSQAKPLHHIIHLNDSWHVVFFMACYAIALLFLVLAFSPNSASGQCPSYCECSEVGTLCCLGRRKAESTDPKCAQLLATLAAGDGPAKPVACPLPWKHLQLRIAKGGWNASRTPGYEPATCLGALEQFTVIGNGNLEPTDGLRRLIPEQLVPWLRSGDAASTITRLTIERTELHIIDSGMMDKLKASAVTELTVRNNLHLNTLGTGWLFGTPQLERLDLEGNALDAVDLARWGVLPASKITHLNLARNKISEVAPDVFDHVAEQLLELNLSSNSITTLSASLFAKMTRLRILRLSDNRLTLAALTGTLPPNLPELRSLDLSHNNLMHSITQANSGFTWWLSRGCPERLATIDLSHADLTSENVIFFKADLPSCRQLKSVDLTANPRLTCLPVDFAIKRSLKLLPDGMTLCSTDNRDDHDDDDDDRDRAASDGEAKTATNNSPDQAAADTVEVPLPMLTDAQNKTDRHGELGTSSSSSLGSLLVVILLSCSGIVATIIIAVALYTLCWRVKRKSNASTARRQRPVSFHAKVPGMLPASNSTYQVVHTAPPPLQVIYQTGDRHLGSYVAACPSLVAAPDCAYFSEFPERSKSPHSDSTANAAELNDETSLANHTKEDTNSSSLNDSGFCHSGGNAAPAPPPQPPTRFTNMVPSASSFFPSATHQFPHQAITAIEPHRPDSICVTTGSVMSASFHGMQHASSLSLNRVPVRSPALHQPIASTTCGITTFVPARFQMYQPVQGNYLAAQQANRHSIILPATMGPIRDCVSPIGSEQLSHHHSTLIGDKESMSFISNSVNEQCF